MYDLEELKEEKINTKDLKISDILNFGNYRLTHGYIVSLKDKNQLYLNDYKIDDYFAVPKEVSKFFTITY